jgi:hypothetical protein
MIAMAAGGSMLVALMITPSESESISYTVRIAVSVVGFIVFCLGARLYLYAHVRDRAEAVVRSRRDSDASRRGREVRESPMQMS